MQVLNSIPESPAEAKLQYTACTLVRKYAAWLANSAVENPALLVPLVPRLLQHSISALHDNLSAGGASLAFAALCSLCAPTIAQHCQAELLSTYETAVRLETWQHRDRRGGPPGPPGSSGSDAGPLEEEDVCSIIEGTAVVLAHEISQNHAGVRHPLTLPRTWHRNPAPVSGSADMACTAQCTLQGAYRCSLPSRSGAPRRSPPSLRNPSATDTGVLHNVNISSRVCGMRGELRRSL